MILLPLYNIYFTAIFMVIQLFIIGGLDKLYDYRRRTYIMNIYILVSFFSL